MQAKMQDQGAEMDKIIEETLSEYTPPSVDLGVAARNLLKYGLSGYNIRVGELQEGFCDHENLRHAPGTVPKNDLAGIMGTLYAVLVERGHRLYAEAIKPYMLGEFEAFAPGSFVSGPRESSQ